MDSSGEESRERIIELERRLDLARDRLVAEVVSSVKKCVEFEERQIQMDAEIARLRRQRGVYWRMRSRAGVLVGHWRRARENL